MRGRLLACGPLDDAVYVYEVRWFVSMQSVFGGISMECSTLLPPSCAEIIIDRGGEVTSESRRRSYFDKKVEEYHVIEVE